MLVVDYPWPPRSGRQTRAFNIGNALRSLGPLTVLSLNGPEGSDEWRAAAREHMRRRGIWWLRWADVSRSLFRGQHVVLTRAERAGLSEVLARELETLKPSIVILGKPFWGEFARASSVVPVLVADVDESIESADRSILKSRSNIRARGRAAIELPAVQRMERRDYPVFDQLWVSTADEQGRLQSWVDRNSVKVVPNAPVEFPGEAPAAAEVTSIGFLGYYQYAPNEESALELIRDVMPLVRSEGLELHLTLVGREPTKRMIAAARGASDITITGEVPNPAATLRTAGVLAMPVRSGGGSRIKALEAISAGVPIISTRFGVKGLGLRPGRDYIEASTPQDFVDAVAQLRADASLRAGLVASAFAVAKDHGSPSAVSRAVLEALAPSP